MSTLGGKCFHLFLVDVLLTAFDFHMSLFNYSVKCEGDTRESKDKGKNS